MAASGWRTDRPLAAQLREDTTRFDFYQLIRLLLRERGASMGELDAHLRFYAGLEHGFPGHEVHALSEQAGRIALETGNYALAGLLGPMPEALVEQMLDRLRDGERAMPGFLDLFNHRLNTLRVQLKAAPRLGLNLLPPDTTPMAGMLAALMGMASPGLAEQMPLPRRTWLGLAGLLGNPRRSAPVLERVVSGFVDAPVALESLVGAWRDRPEGTFTQLTAQRDPRAVPGQDLGLGRQTRLGQRAWMPAACVRLHIGPLSYARFFRLLPRPDTAGNRDDGYAPLASLLRVLTQRRQDVWVHLRLDPTQVPRSRLTARPSQPDPQVGRYYGLRLGQTAWLGRGKGRKGKTVPEAQAQFLVRAFPEATP